MIHLRSTAVQVRVHDLPAPTNAQAPAPSLEQTAFVNEFSYANGEPLRVSYEKRVGVNGNDLAPKPCSELSSQRSLGALSRFRSNERRALPNAVIGSTGGVGLTKDEH